MSVTTTNLHCPECGAPLKAGDRQCWMCYRLLAESSLFKADPALPAASEPHAVRFRTNIWAVLGIAVAGVAMVPAACIAFFATCLATMDSDPSGTVTLTTSCGAALVVFVGFCVLIGAMSTKVTRQIPASGQR